MLQSVFFLGTSLGLLALTRVRWRPWATLLWVVCSNLWKIGLIQDHLDSPVHLAGLHWWWQALTLTWLVLFCQWLAPRRWLRWVWILQAFLSSLWLLDQIYERFFDDVPGLYLLTQLSQAKAVLPSALELLQLSDLALVLDTLLALPLLWLSGQAPARSRLGPWLVLPLLASLLALTQISQEDLRILRLRFRNVAAVQRLGLLHYHIYDGLQMAYSRHENLLNRRYNQDLLQKLVSQSRASVRTATPFLGRYRGRNVLVFQLESFEKMVLNLKVDGQEVTPFLNQLARKSWTAGLQDQSGQGRSSDGEFILLNSLLPPGTRPLVYAYPSNVFAGLPALLTQQGYFSNYAVAYYGSFWNCRYMARRYGFHKGLFREEIPSDPRHTIGWGLSDYGLVNRLKSHWKQFPRPLLTYTVTMMGHYPYEELRRDQERLVLSSRFDDTMLGRYLQICRERDEEWKNIVEVLKQEGLWQSSLVVLVGDHDARIPYHEMALLQASGRFDEVDKVVNDRVFCLIHSPDEMLRGQGPEFAAQVDLLPTLLHLLGYPQASATLGLNLLAPLKTRRAIVSKTGYALDRDYVVVDNGSHWSTYSRATHLLVNRNDLPVQQEMRDWYDLTRDILRLDLVPTMLGY